MEQSNSTNAASDNIAGDEIASASARPSAIERQLAAVSGLDHGNPTHREAADMTYRHIVDYNTHRHPPRHFGLMHFLVLLMFIAVALALVFTDLGRPLQKAIGALPVNYFAAPTAGKVVRDNSASTTNSALAAGSSSASVVQAPANSLQTPENSVQTPTAPSTATPTTPAQTTASTTVAKASTPDAVSIPVADVSLRYRPELLEQLVQIYQSQLIDDPNNTTAREALAQLQERSLTELQTIVQESDKVTATKSLEIVARLFPQAAESARSKYAAATALPEIKAPAVTAPAKIASSSADAPSSKPEIRSVSITPGTLKDNRFVPGDGGNVFMVEISYRNFDKAFEENNEATLVALLGAPGDSLVLAEVPVTISADRGTKSFAMETTNVQGYAGGKFHLNFLLNDEFLTSRTVRLSRP